MQSHKLACSTGITVLHSLLFCPLIVSWGRERERERETDRERERERERERCASIFDILKAGASTERLKSTTSTSGWSFILE